MCENFVLCYMGGTVVLIERWLRCHIEHYSRIMTIVQNWICAIQLQIVSALYCFMESLRTLLFSWAGGTAVTAPDCKSSTLETSEVRILFCPVHKAKIQKESRWSDVAIKFR